MLSCKCNFNPETKMVQSVGCTAFVCLGMTSAEERMGRGLRSRSEALFRCIMNDSC